MSTYSDRLKLELMATGANANVWGTRTNNNLGVIEAFGAGYVSKSVAGSADVTLTTGNADATTESANKVIEFTGTLTGNIKVFVPAVENNYIFFNNTAGSFTLTVAPTGHAANGVAITQGAHTIQYCTGNKIIDLFANSLGTVGVKNLVNVGSTAVKIEANGRLTATSFTGSGADLTGVSTLPSGTQMVFLEGSAPTGWTQNTAAALANSTLKVITSGTAGTAGSDAFGDTFGSSRATETADVGLNVAPVTVDASSVSLGDTTLAIPTIASHTHPTTTTPLNQAAHNPGSSFFGTGVSTGSTGGGGAHGHPMASASGSVSGTVNTPTSFSVPTMDVKHANAIVCSKD
tara:strand:- start:15278 stop:16318 length:1041 start_codon:yes stop_codon:yes gene_type:complete